mmetsp:Transcript_116410/g.324386  ORF Transcript_116410/g.324386 Transcript_116410/m.324386 type:complete len:224 (+) Transcript_116410:171-842(+)
MRRGTHAKSTTSSRPGLPSTAREASGPRGVCCGGCSSRRCPPPPAVRSAASSRKRRSRAPGSAPPVASLVFRSGVTMPEEAMVETAPTEKVLLPPPTAERLGCKVRTCSTTAAKCWYSTAARSEARRCARACRTASARSRRTASGRSSESALRGSRSLSRSPRLGVRGAIAEGLPGVMGAWAAVDFLGVCGRPPPAAPRAAAPVDSLSMTASKKWAVVLCTSS